MRNIRRFCPFSGLHGDRAGATSVELALLAPILLVVLFALFDIGRLVLAGGTMEYAAQEGAHFASLRGSSSLAPTTEAEIAALVRSLIHGIDSSAVSVTVSWEPDSATGSTVSVRTAYEHRVLMGLLPIPPVSLGGRASLVVL